MINKIQLEWAMLRMAQMQGAVADVLALRASVASLDQADAPMLQLQKVASQMGLQAPLYMDQPDRAHLPLLGHTAQLGWVVLVDCDPSGQWILVNADGQHSLAPTALQGQVALIKFNAQADAHKLSQAMGEKPAMKTFAQQLQQTLRQHRLPMIEAGLASAFIGMIALATSLFSMQVYDRVIPSRSEYTLVVLSTGVLLSILIEYAMKLARSHLMDYVVTGVDHRLSREVFQQLLSLRVDQVPSSVGSLAGQLRGYEQVRSFYTANTLFTLIDLPMSLLFLVIIALIASPLVALVPLVFGGVALFLGLRIRTQVKDLARESAALSNMRTGLLVEAVEGIETIKAGSGGWKFLSRWINYNKMTIQGDLRMRGATENVGYLSVVLQQMSYAGLVVVGSLLVMQGHMTMGALIACSILSGRILAPIMALPGLLVQHSHASAALEGLERLYTLESDNHGIQHPLVPTHIKGHYLLTDVQFAYGQNPPVIAVPRLEIKPGERIAIVGPIGAGKSTLLRMLSGMYSPQKGNISIDGLELGHISRQLLSQKIGFLQQDHRLFQGSLRENLLIGLPDPGDEVIFAAMNRTGMDRIVGSHPKGLERPIMEGGKGLSNGQKQLVAFTRLILCKPDILLLDEPTATMDDTQERQCMAVLAEEARAGKTLVIVTHKPSTLALVNRIIVVAGSSIVLDGPRDTVLQQLQQRPNAQPAS
ncbi:ATP-binding cassette domain-containing protein [uncultured Limnohabitans sp.]|jgi:ATP-binding cassette subfamily C protein LapB|uniref:ATP-binding cassette domain-containing protein n=1 Tax=uncultured Limnohabitans sp. TaxID=768543 RepID=UPI001B5E0E00|nr:ATP-binding cassette domain-containing protein [uncultured Limnohabitans sp.]MBP6220773.1 ATP-binding cassette domain-containing protein [Limnohabitans sp.]MBP6245312.1 ATP-binding cassette domain-containing protein [Limnohabitans sp.]